MIGDERYSRLTSQFRDGIQHFRGMGNLLNEAATRSVLISPILETLGYSPTYRLPEYHDKATRRTKPVTCGLWTTNRAKPLSFWKPSSTEHRLTPLFPACAPIPQTGRFGVTSSSTYPADLTPSASSPMVSSGASTSNRPKNGVGFCIEAESGCSLKFGYDALCVHQLTHGQPVLATPYPLRQP